MSDSNLGERCVQWCRDRMAEQDPPRLITIAHWAEACERRGKNIGGWLAGEMRTNGTRFHHCAIAQSEAARVCVQDGETIPHKHRAGAAEMVHDCIGAGSYHLADEVRQGLWMPSVGDLAFYDRSTAGKPATSGFRHVDRVTAVYEDSFQNLGANETWAPPLHGGGWRLQTTKFAAPRLLGFGSYRQAPPIILLDNRELEDARSLAEDMPAMMSAEPMWWNDYDSAKVEHLERLDRGME